VADFAGFPRMKGQIVKAMRHAVYTVVATVGAVELVLLFWIFGCVERQVGPLKMYVLNSMKPNRIIKVFGCVRRITCTYFDKNTFLSYQIISRTWISLISLIL
jgi:hypothetical protein